MSPPERWAGGPTVTLDAFAAELAAPAAPPAEAWRPTLVALAPGELAPLRDLGRAHGFTTVDTFDAQLAELARCRHPAPGAEAARAGLVADALEARGAPEAAGVWTYLPWAGRVVHVLGPAEYREVVTNRNRDKITREEQELLATRRVAAVGLSVGAEAAVAVAQEHLCGTLALADFDRLDLSNLNRLAGSCADLGLPKATLAARRVVGLDPYLGVEVFGEGLHEGNMDAFLEGADLLLEECDGLAMKYHVRTAARERGIDVVFAADERGFLSVEPYGSRPDLLPFHGRVRGPQPPREAYATPLEHMRALTEWMGGWDRISDRSRRSLERLGDTLCGYPQLAGEARFAAGQVAHVARRLLLGERLPPSLLHLDLEELVPS